MTLLLEEHVAVDQNVAAVQEHVLFMRLWKRTYVACGSRRAYTW